MGNFFEEVKRRNVVRVGIAYSRFVAGKIEKAMIYRKSPLPLEG